MAPQGHSNITSGPSKPPSADPTILRTEKGELITIYVLASLMLILLLIIGCFRCGGSRHKRCYIRGPGATLGQPLTGLGNGFATGVSNTEPDPYDGTTDGADHGGDAVGLVHPAGASEPATPSCLPSRTCAFCHADTISQQPSLPHSMEMARLAKVERGIGELYRTYITPKKKVSAISEESGTAGFDAGEEDRKRTGLSMLMMRPRVAGDGGEMKLLRFGDAGARAAS